jgi:DNA-directed RNA polymerase subunit RPC12/RpoP
MHDAAYWRLGQGAFQVIDASRGQVRLSCEVCGAHVVHEKDKLGPHAVCPVCGDFREIVQRRPALSYA